MAKVMVEFFAQLYGDAGNGNRVLTGVEAIVGDTRSEGVISRKAYYYDVGTASQTTINVPPDMKGALITVLDADKFVAYAWKSKTDTSDASANTSHLDVAFSSGSPQASPVAQYALPRLVTFFPPGTASSPDTESIDKNIVLWLQEMTFS